MKPEWDIVNSEDDLSQPNSRPRLTAADMKSVAWFFAAILSILISAVIVYTLTAKKDKTPDINQNTIPPSAQTYVVKEYDGKVAVFVNSESVPIEVYDTDTESLPETDKQYLSNGISVKSDEELEAIIEDLTS